MAWWAFWMFIATGASVGVTGFGVYYVKHTLEETRAANRIAREVGEAQTRAYISVVDASCEILVRNRCPKVRLNIRNSGNSPAKQLVVRIRGVYSSPAGVDRIQNDFYPKKGRRTDFGVDIAAGETRDVDHVLSNFPFGVHEDRVVESQSILVFQPVIRIEFVDVFGKVISEYQHWFGYVEGIGKRLKLRRISPESFRMMLQLQEEQKNRSA